MPVLSETLIRARRTGIRSRLMNNYLAGVAKMRIRVAKMNVVRNEKGVNADLQRHPSVAVDAITAGRTASVSCAACRGSGPAVRRLWFDCCGCGATLLRAAALPLPTAPGCKHP